MLANVSSHYYSLCIKSQAVYTNPWLIALFSLTLLIDIVAFICCIFGAKSTYFTSLTHVNLRIPMVSILIALLVRAFFTAYRCIRYLKRAAANTNPCDFLEVARFCRIYSELNSFGYRVAMFSIPIITIERLVALIASARYEKWTFPKLVLCICLIPWFHATYCLYQKAMSSVNEYFPVVYCNSEMKDIQKIQKIEFVRLLNIQLLLPFACLCVTILMLVFCKHIINKQTKDFNQHSLSHRFQLKEVLKTANIAIPASSLFCIFHVTNVAIVTVPISTGWVRTVMAYSLCKELGACTALPIYSIIYGILLHYYNNNNRAKSFKLFTCCRKQVTPSPYAIDGTKDMEQYFTTYAARWR